MRDDVGTGSRETGGSSAGFLRLPEGLAARYRIERELPTRGNEADLFVVRPVEGGAEVVAKLYRAGIEPKDEVLTRIAALDGRYVIRQIEHGKSEGRFYEVIEYAASGSLADLMRETRFDGAMLKAMIADVTAGLGYLHGLDPPIVHRDVKPDNILVRGREPLDLVMTDFGLSSVLESGSWRASSLDRTIKYAAPEASAGQVSREMDWWSLGMMVAEAFRGLHPFAGVAEQTIGIHYSNRRPVPLDGIDDERVKLLCQGLLCYDRKQRWGADEVGRWLAGDGSLRAPVEEVQQAAGVPFKFAGGPYRTLQALAAAMAGNWTAAEKIAARADGLLAWLKDEAKEYEAWQWLSEIAQDKAQLDAGLKVTLLLPMLDPSLPVMFEGEALTPERLLAEVSAAVEGTDSARTARLTQLWEHIPALAELSPGAAWLGEARVGAEKARSEADTLTKALGSEAPKIAATNTWGFVRHVLERAHDPGAHTAERGAAEALLGQLPNDAASWVNPLKAADRSAAGASWLMLQLEPHLRELTVEMERRAKAEAVVKIAAEQAARIMSLQGELHEAGWIATPQAGHTESDVSLAITPDGRHLVKTTGGAYDAAVQLWEIATGRLLRTFTGPGWYSSVAVTPDGRHLLTGSSDSTVRLWDLVTGEELRVFSGHHSRCWIKSIAVTPDGRHLVAGSNSGFNLGLSEKSARLWDMETGKELRSFIGHTKYVVSVAVTPDGRHLVTGSGDKTARLWDLATGQELRQFIGHTEGVGSVVLTPDGRHLVTGSHDESVRLWDLSTGRELRVFTGNMRWVNDAAVTPDGRHLVTASGDESIRLWDISTGRVLRTFNGHKGVSSIAITPDGRQLVTGGHRLSARLWDLATGRELRELTGPKMATASHAITPNGHHLVAGSGEETLSLWDLVTGHQLRVFLGHKGEVQSVAVTPDGHHLLTGSKDKTARLWDLHNGRELRAFTGHTGSVDSVAVTPDGRNLVTGSDDKTARLWDVANGRELRAFTSHTGSVQSVAVTPDGRHLVTGSGDKTARLWDIATGREVRSFTGHDDQVYFVAVTPDGRHLVTGSGDKTARLWDLSTGRELRTFVGHTDTVRRIAVTRDGRHLVTASWDRTMRLWDVNTGKETSIFFGHSGVVNSIAVMPDGNHMMTGSADQTVRIWDIATARLVKFMRLVNEHGRLTFGPSGGLAHIDGDPSALLHFVRGMEVLTVPEILNDPSETWRQKPIGSESDNPSTREALARSLLDPKFEQEVQVLHSRSNSTTPISPKLEPLATEQWKPVEPNTSPLLLTKASMIQTFIRKLFQ